MLRIQVHRDDSVVKDEEEIVAISEPQDQESLRPYQTDEEFLWMLLLAAVSECVTTCFVPVYTLQSWGLNVSGTALNWIGPFLDGLTYGYYDHLNGAEVSLVCMQFRSAFLGYHVVLTSFPFMADHAGDLSGNNFLAGPIYVCTSILGGCGFFCLGKQALVSKWTTPTLRWSSKMVNRMKTRPSLMTILVAFVGLTTLRAALGPHGFVRDPKDPQFIGPLQVADGEELILGIFMSCSAVLFSKYICDIFASQQGNAVLPNGDTSIDWGCLCCNLLASFLAGLTYQLNRVSAPGVTGNILALKFVSSFCGSLSVFSGAVSVISRLWLAGNRHSALWNLALQLLVGLLVMPYLYKHEVR